MASCSKHVHSSFISGGASEGDERGGSKLGGTKARRKRMYSENPTGFRHHGLRELCENGDGDVVRQP